MLITQTLPEHSQHKGSQQYLLLGSINIYFLASYQLGLAASSAQQMSSPRCSLGDSSQSPVANAAAFPQEQKPNTSSQNHTTLTRCLKSINMFSMRTCQQAVGSRCAEEERDPTRHAFTSERHPAHTTTGTDQKATTAWKEMLGST